MNIVEKAITDRGFLYLPPWFYNHPHALRCELGMGDSKEAYWANAETRAMEIYRILFPQGADAIFFDYWVYDLCTTGGPGEADFDSPEEMREYIEYQLKYERERLEFLLSYQMKYRHLTLRNLVNDDPYSEENPHIRNRVICFSDGKGFDIPELIRRNLDGQEARVSFVSFENECVFSVYDSRGCDVVFMTPEKMREFYPLLKPYFLEYDLQEMERRYPGTTE